MRLSSTEIPKEQINFLSNRIIKKLSLLINIQSNIVRFFLLLLQLIFSWLLIHHHLVIDLICNSQLILIYCFQMQNDMLRDFYRKIRLIAKTNKKEIWLVKNTLDGELCVAKLQNEATMNVSKKNNTRNILHQGKFMQTNQGYPGIPFLNWAGKDDSIGLSMVIIERLGSTIEKLLAEQGGKFSVKTVCQLGISIFNILHCYHDKGYVHGNLKLNCLQFGVGHKSRILYLNDFMDSLIYFKKGKHIKKEMVKNKIKMHQFMSFDRMQGYESSRRDDVQSTLLILVYLIKGSLPWSGLFQKLSLHQTALSEKEGDSVACQKQVSISKEMTNEQTLKFNKTVISEQKYHQLQNKLLTKVDETTIQQICSGISEQFKKMLQQCRAMEYESRPSYNYYIRELRKIMREKDIEEDGRYDWMVGKNTRLIINRPASIQDLLIHLPFEKQILAQIYDPFEKKIDLI